MMHNHAHLSVCFEFYKYHTDGNLKKCGKQAVYVLIMQPSTKNNKICG